MDWDELAEEQSQHFFAAWLRLLMQKMPDLPLRLAAQHQPGKEAVEASPPTNGSYNICSVVTFSDGSKVVVRLPIMGRSRFRLEKTYDELMAMTYLSERVAFPLPEILGQGMWAGGPYIVTKFVEGVVLSKCERLRDPTSESPGLRPDVSTADLRRAYQGMAGILLELYKLDAPQIGGICHVPGAWKITKRPLTLQMNELVRVSNVPHKHFANDSFHNSSEYFQELANQHFLHLKYQRNNAIDDADDCKKKYIARCLFRKIVKEIRFERPPYRFYCDDLRPSNVLVASETDFTVKAVIDWEFTYSAPVEFSHAAPWWLLIKNPEAWGADLRGFLEEYKPRLELFLEVMRECEDERIKAGDMDESGRLSRRMAQSMDNGVFWLSMAGRRSSMFDDIYWTFLDYTFFGPFESLEDRMSLLTESERDEMSGFIEEKLRQKEEHTLDEHMTLDEMMDL